MNYSSYRWWWWWRRRSYRLRWRRSGYKRWWWQHIFNSVCENCSGVDSMVAGGEGGGGSGNTKYWNPVR
jgi:hypothetical protein